MQEIEKSGDSLRIDLRIVFYREAGFWIAHCLEMDVLGHAATKNVALENLAGAIVTQIEQSIQNDNPANIVQLADAKYFAMFFSGKDFAVAASIVQQIRKSVGVSGKVQVEGIEGREFSRVPALV